MIDPPGWPSLSLFDLTPQVAPHSVENVTLTPGEAVRARPWLESTTRLSNFDCERS